MKEYTRILVVDDDAALSGATSHLLRGAGYQVIEATTGGDGLRLAREGEPDLVLLNVVLPDMDGLEMCRQIKADARLAGSYVVLLSALRTTSDNQSDGLEAGADGYIARPIADRELLARVEAIMRLKRAQDALGERIKELNCLYGISQLVETPGMRLEGILQGAVELIPAAWRYPEKACARIILGGQEFRTDRFQETIWQQACNIQVGGIPAGRVEVYYLEERPGIDEGPFSEDERKLLNAVAERLGRIVERTRAEEALAGTTRLLETVLDHTHVLVACLDSEFNFLRVNRAYAEADKREPSFFPGKNHFDLYPNRENEEIFREVVETGQPYFAYAKPFEYAEHPERGVSFWDWSLVPIRDSVGGVTGLILTLANVTERVQADETLRESGRRLEFALHAAHAGWFDNDLAEGIVKWDDTTRRIWGVDRDTFEPSLDYVFQAIHPDDQDCAIASFKAALESDADEFTVEYRIIQPSGAVRWKRDNMFILRDENGRALRYVGATIDTTERKQAEEKLQWELDVNAALSALYEPLISPGSSIEEIANTVLDQARCLTRSTHGYVSALDPVTGDNVGYTLTEMLKGNCKVSGEDRRIAFPRGSDGRYPGLWGHSLNTGQAFYTNSPETHPAYQGTPEGHIPVQQFLSVPVKLGEELVGQIAVANPGRDYTERDLEALQRIGEFYALAIQRKRAEKALRDSEEKYRDLVEQVSDAIYALDTDGLITYVSPAIEALIGYRPPEVVGRSFAQFIAPEELPRIQNNFQQLASGRLLGPNEYRLATKSGEVRWMRASSQPIVAGDQVAGVRGVLTDVTDRVRSEVQLQETAAAAERERLARELHDAVTQVLFSASLIADTLPRVWERHPEEGRLGLEELRRLTHGALAEMRTLLLELRPGALSEQNLSVLLRQLAEGMMARTRMHVTTTVVGDCPLPGELQIALYRITQEALNNVVKHARAKWAKVNLHCESERVTMSISDDGRGFDPDTTQPDQLGLRIMHERAQAVGATLSIKSRPGQGTEITVVWSRAGETTDSEWRDVYERVRLHSSDDR